MAPPSSIRPIIYVRGYAGTQREVENTVDLPYYGFNLGSTKIHTGVDGRPGLYIFESPLIRMMRDHGYTDYFVRITDDGKSVVLLKSTEKDRYERASLWIYRYYDATSKSVGSGRRSEMETLAIGLGKVVDYVLAKTGADMVYLVAHSMGGLICRSLIQKIWPEESSRKIAKLFTYASPHNGIDFRKGLSWIGSVRDVFGVNDSDVFGPKRMRQYLNLRNLGPDRMNEVSGKFPVERVFCLVGTNYQQYDAAAGFSRSIVGPGSDGLVMQDHAYVKGSSRAYVHRCHSGPYGIVNSEEGYQNLQRFLFGDTAVKITLSKVKVSKEVANYKYLANLLVETEVSIRGQVAFMHQRREDQGSAITVTPKQLERGEETLYQTYLMSSKRAVLDTGSRAPRQDQYSHFAVRIRIRPQFVKARLVLRDRYYVDQELFNASLVIGVSDPDKNGARLVKHAWGTFDSDLPPQGIRVATTGQLQQFNVPLPPRPKSGPNRQAVGHHWIESGSVTFSVRRWE